MDRYASFKDLQDNEVEGIDYRIRCRAGSTGIALLCIHGGDIEPGTSEIAEGIAGHDHTFYALEGLKSSGNKALHITSTAFDEPSSIEILCTSEIIVSVHGCSEMEETVHIGGRDQTLKERIAKKLDRVRFRGAASIHIRGSGDRSEECLQFVRPRDGGSNRDKPGIEEQNVSRSFTLEGRHFRSEVYYRFVFAVRDALRPFAWLEPGRRNRTAGR